MPINSPPDCSWQVCCSFPPPPAEKQIAFWRGSPYPFCEPEDKQLNTLCVSVLRPSEPLWMLFSERPKRIVKEIPLDAVLKEIKKNGQKAVPDKVCCGHGRWFLLDEHLQDVNSVIGERIWGQAEEASVQMALWDELCELWMLQQDSWLMSPEFLLITRGTYDWC